MVRLGDRLQDEVADEGKIHHLLVEKIASHRNNVTQGKAEKFSHSLSHTIFDDSRSLKFKRAGETAAFGKSPLSYRLCNF